MVISHKYQLAKQYIYHQNYIANQRHALSRRISCGYPSLFVFLYRGHINKYSLRQNIIFMRHLDFEPDRLDAARAQFLQREKIAVEALAIRR